MSAGPQLVPQGPPPPNPADLTGSTVGRYSIRKRLGAGGMGEVYLADDTTLKRTVAMKRLGERVRTDEQYRKRFIKEAERASRLSHPHIASLFDVLEHNGELFLIIEHIEGETLRRRMKEPVSLEQFLQIAVQCADALEAAHQSGLVHRDIKPENIMLRESGQVKVLDFGLAKELPSAGAPTMESVGGFGNLSGTPAYMAPETLLELPPDARADIFSLGVVFYEMLAGKHPFLAATFLQTSERIVHHDPEPITSIHPDLPKELDRILARMMAKRADDRYASAADVAADLRDLQRALSFPTTAPYYGTRTSKRLLISRRMRLQQYALMAALVLALAAGGFAVWRLRQVSAEKQLTGLPALPQKQLAILPFEVSGEQVTNTAISDGFSEVLAAKLGQLSDRYPLAVVPPSELRAQHINNAEQARRVFGVNLVLLGSYRQAGNNVRISYTLVDAGSQRQIHGDVLTASAGDPFALEDTLIQSVLNTLDLALRPQERETLRARGTTEPGAYDFYLRGRGYLSEYEKPENLDSAIEEFTRALEKDKNYALAYAGMGQAYWLKYKSAPDAALAAKAQEACEKAVKLGDSAAPAHDCLGTVLAGRGQYSDAATQFRRALELDATDDGAYRGLAAAYERTGQAAEAEKIYQRAIALRPNYWSSYNWLGALYVSEGRYAEAADQFKKALDLAPDSFRGYSNLGGAYVAAGRFDDAIPILEKSVNIRPNYGGYTNLGTAYYSKRNFQAAVKNNLEATKLKPTDFVTWNNLAEAQLWAGDTPGSADSYNKSAELARAALKLNPSDIEANMALAAALAAQHQNRASRAALDRALKLSSSDPDLQLRAAVIEMRMTDSSSAIASLRQAMQLGLPRVRVDNTPEFDSLRQKPEFQALLTAQKS